MRRLNVTQYMVSALQSNGTYKEIPYKAKESLINLMFHPELKLGGVDLLKQNIIAEKILKAGIDVLLEEEEYKAIKRAIDSFHGFTKNEVELVQRVTDCPEIKVEEEKKKK